MKINGRQIAQEIFTNLTNRVEVLKKKNIIPRLAIILVGNNPASVTYVRQKELKAKLIGAKTTILNYELGIKNEELVKKIKQLNNDKNVHGIIVQRPLPAHINQEEIDNLVNPQKDVDAFLPNSPYEMPLAKAVLFILEKIYDSTPGVLPRNFIEWLCSKKIVVIGKGRTGGGPTILLLKKLGIESKVIDSKTINPELLTINADIIISTVGKLRTIKAENLKQGVILIGVGMSRGEDGRLHGDYEENEIENIASAYTPIPGGVGPVNVAMLLSNLIQSAEQ